MNTIFLPLISLIIAENICESLRNLREIGIYGQALIIKRSWRQKYQSQKT